MTVYGKPLAATQAWLDVIGQVLEHGNVVEVQGLHTREIVAYPPRWVDPLRPFVRIPDRKVSHKFACAEASWILRGHNRVDELVKYAPSFRNYSDDGVYMSGAYGPKFVDQLPYIIHCLRNDDASRQAVINVWRERPYQSKDVPCTLSMQFLVRESGLWMIVTMRSSDVWLGWPYDIFSFSMICIFVSLTLVQFGITAVPAGVMIQAGSQHLYEKDWARADVIREKEFIVIDRAIPVGEFSCPEELMFALMSAKDEEEYGLLCLP